MNRSSSLIIHSLPHVAALVVIVLCTYLAVWQFDRADEKRGLLRAWEQAESVSLGNTVEKSGAYGRVMASGRFDGSRQILLDNKIRYGRPGVHVFTPFRPENDNRYWLVNRGWHALPSRQGPLPEIDAPDGLSHLSGRLTEPPRVGRQLGEAQALQADEWPNLVTYLDLGRIEAALDVELAEQVILLSPDHPAHLTGDEWRPINFGPDRHRAYAWQWITMAAAVFLIWVVLTWRRFRRA